MQVDPAREGRLDLDLAAGTPPGGPSRGPVAYPDIAAFASTIHAALESSVVGYEFELRQHGTKLHELSWNWSRTPIDGDLTWNENRRMHIASVSKLLTAVALVKALDDQRISCDATIGRYLPGYWARGPKIDQITFRHLLTHLSGFSTGSSSANFEFMKSRVAAGVAVTPGSTYRPENMNFGLCRILIPIVAGMIGKDASYGFTQDVAWDAATLALYKGYMQSNVFSPAGLGEVGWAPAAGGALAYRQPHANLPGWNSGDLRSAAGSDGWRLSVKELLDVMNHVRRQNTIVTPQRAQTILDSRFGIDHLITTPVGRSYATSGIWGAKTGEVEQCAAFFFPQAIEAVLFVNSPTGAQSHSLRGLVQAAYEGSVSV